MQILLVYEQGMYTFQPLPEMLRIKLNDDEESRTVGAGGRPDPGQGSAALVSPALNRKY